MWGRTRACHRTRVCGDAHALTHARVHVGVSRLWRECGGCVRTCARPHAHARLHTLATRCGQVRELERQLAASKELLSTHKDLLQAQKQELGLQLVLADRWEAEARFFRSLTGTKPELSFEVGDA